MSMLTDIQPVNSGIIALKTRGNGLEPLFRDARVLNLLDEPLNCFLLLSG